MLDHKGRKLQSGQTVVRGFRNGNTGGIEERIVSKVNEKGVYLDGSHVPVTRTDCLYIID